MAATTPTNVDTSIPELWAKAVLRDQLYAGFFKNMIGGEGSGQPIIQKTEVLNKPGDTIHVQVTVPLVGAGVSGDTSALAAEQGGSAEENLLTAEKLVVPVLYRHAVRSYRRASKKSIIDLRGEARLRLAEWGEQKMDSVRFANFVQTTTMNGQTYTPNLQVIGGGTGVDDIGVGDTLSVAQIQKAALTLYNNRAKPVVMDGQPTWVLVAHPNSLYDLKREAEYRDWVREAHIRGADNPFFKGAVAMVDGVVIFQHVNVPKVVNAGTKNVSKNLMFGAEAFVEGVDENASWAEDEFDYGFQFGIAYQFAFQPRRGLEQNSLQILALAEPPA